jgi:hypothetical protein
MRTFPESILISCDCPRLETRGYRWASRTLMRSRDGEGLMASLNAIDKTPLRVSCCAQQTGMNIDCECTTYSIETVYGEKGHLYTPNVRPVLLATPRRFTGDHPALHRRSLCR